MRWTAHSPCAANRRLTALACSRLRSSLLVAVRVQYILQHACSRGSRDFGVECECPDWSSIDQGKDVD
jgi:hypothetical protein